MKMETLVATIDQKNYDLAAKMNLQTDAVIGNQCGRLQTETMNQNGNRITWLHTAERGIGKNRNLLLEQAAADICILADDDMCFVDGYPEIAKQAFAACPDGDLLVFNLLEKEPRRYRNTKIMRIRSHNCAKYGAARIAFRRKPVLEAGIRFSLLFGGGAKYGSGEDTIFLKDCLKAGLKIYAVPYALAWIDQSAASTWFTGYHETFFRDKGALYACLHPVMWPVFSLRFALKIRKKADEEPYWKTLLWMFAGGREYKKERRTA